MCAEPHERVQACVALLPHLQLLEVSLLDALKLPSNHGPVVSAGAFTSVELDVGVNDSNDPEWLVRNVFLDLCSESNPEALRRHVLAQPPDVFNTMILCTRHRKAFLSVSADGTRKASAVIPGDELMKAIGRAAKRLSGSKEHGPYDPPSGIAFLVSLLHERGIVPYSDVERKLAAKIEGRQIPLDESEHLLLWETLSSKAAKSVTPAGVTAEVAKHHAVEPASYFVDKQRANAIRLVGAADEWFSEEFVHIRYDPTPYSMPAAIAADYQVRLARISEAARDHGAQFFDGPCARLIRVIASSQDASERKHLDVHLGPIGWHDFSVADDLIHEAQRRGEHRKLVA
jgi:hypothetical protein